jgi:hypothetical protein
LIVTGTPSSSPTGSPLSHRCSELAAAMSAPSLSTMQNALIFGCRR